MLQTTVHRPLHIAIARALRSACVLATFCATVAPAQADSVDFYGTANGSVATTDNVSGLPSGVPGRRGDIFSDVRPGFLATYYAPRMIHELQSEVDFLYHLATGRPTVTFRGGWRAFFLPSPRTEMSTSADASMGQLNALTASLSPLDDPTQIIPPGRVNTTNFDGGENLSWVTNKNSQI